VIKGPNAIHIKIIDSLNLTCPQTDSVFLITGLNTPSTQPILSFASTGIDTTKKFCGSDIQTIFSSKPTGANSYLFLRNLTDSMQWGIKSTFTSGAKKFNNNEIVTVIATNTVSGCSKSSAYLLVTVNPQPKANFTYVSNTGLVKQFNDSSIGKTQIWNWNFGDNNFSSLKNPLHNYLTQGTFNVSLNIIDSNNCKDSISKAINVSTVGIITLSEIAELSVYPNPAVEQIQISYELKNSSSIHISIYDMQGREIFIKRKDNESIGTHDEQISIETFPLGIYLLMIKSGQQQRLVKFIKQ
jgi:PKD repeat protein